MPKKTVPAIDLAKGFKELEEIAAWFESGETDIEKGIERFERAAVLAAALKERLTAAENTIQEMKKRL
jgi:exodeoxyribonuclease VII small subunit